MRDTYCRNGRFFHAGETDLENPRDSWIGPGCYWSAPVGVPFEILHDLEERFYRGGGSCPLVLPKGIYVVLRVGDAESCSWIERLGDGYTPVSRRTRDEYWKGYRAQRAASSQGISVTVYLLREQEIAALKQKTGRHARQRLRELGVLR